MRMMLLCLALAACEGADGQSGKKGGAGSDGAAGATGPAGPAGPTGPAGEGAFHWVDMNGTRATSGESLFTFTDDGVLWAISADQGVATASAFTAYYSDESCTEEGHTLTIAPMWAVQTPDGQYRYRPPSVQVASMTYRSTATATFGCTTAGVPGEVDGVVPIAEMVLTAPPTLGLTPPLYPVPN